MASSSFSFTILGSGSGGNCAYLETPRARLLIDAGLSCRQIQERLASIGKTFASLDGVLVTHEHSDHVSGLKVLCQKHHVPLYCNRLTKEALAEQLPAEIGWRVFATGEAFEMNGVVVESFSIPHDAVDPVGFMLHAGERRIAFLTDLGYMTRLAVERTRGAAAIVLETNHDVEMLQKDSRRPWSVKQRILSRHGHLSNAAAAAALADLVDGDLRHLFLGHLSRDCNHPDLARTVIEAKLAEMQACHVSVEVAEQDKPAATMSW